MKPINIGLFGFGCVGQGLYETINNSTNFSGEIKKICIKHPEKHRSLPQHLFTTEAEELIHDPELDIIVELIDDAEAAKSIVTQALQNGKSVVSANKKMIAQHLEELVTIQQETGKALLYEGAVCGSIPIIRTLEEYFGHEPLTALKGIVNGSTNYILTQIFTERLPYALALEKAQALGFAESDPRLDVQGEDAKYKLVILLAHAFGLFVKPQDLLTVGIDQISSYDLAYAHANELEIKLFATARKVGDKVFAFVLPQFVHKSHSLINVRNEFNAVSLTGEFCDEQLLLGKGAGSLPTGAAVLSDVSALSYDYQYEYKKKLNSPREQLSNESLIEAYVSFKNPEAINLDVFEHITERHFSFEQSHVIGELCIEKVVRMNWQNNADVNIVLTTKEPSETLGKLSVGLLHKEVLALQEGKNVLEKISI